MKGNIPMQMADGIDRSHAVVTFITARYMDKANGFGKDGQGDNCFLEFDYAATTKTASHIVVVVMEKDMKSKSRWKGKVGLALINALFIDFSDDALLHTAAEEIAGRLRDIRRMDQERLGLPGSAEHNNNNNTAASPPPQVPASVPRPGTVQSGKLPVGDSVCMRGGECGFLKMVSVSMVE